MGDAAYISESSLAALKRLQQRRPARECCELCARPLGDRHPHLLEPNERRLVCACEPCSFLFQGDTGRYRRIPRDSYHLADLALDDLLWESLSIPINLAFFFFSSAANRVVSYYPSPGGAMESLVNLESWAEVAARHPRLQQLRPDVEAFLAHRLATPHQYYLVPIDRCYELSGIVRKHWQGFTGGDDVWREIAGFFTALQQEAISVYQGTTSVVPHQQRRGSGL
jgi:hypothetical protein